MKTKKKKPEAEERVSMEGTASQFSLIVRALDFYCRMLAGQWGELDSIFRMNYDKVNYDQVNNVRRILDSLKGMLLPHFTDIYGFGITDPRLPMDAKRAYEIQKWIQNHLVRNVKDAHCAGAPPFRVTEQEQVHMSEASQDDLVLRRMSRTAHSLTLMLEQMGIAVEICKVCGIAHSKGEKHECCESDNKDKRKNKKGLTVSTMCGMSKPRR